MSIAVCSVASSAGVRSVRWYLTIKAFRWLRRIGAPGLAEWWSEVSGLRARLLAAVKD